ncbi:hypothetical protein BDR26DRAFT_871995 [Obelidium mucronatum]|nr:hypothetical protein BDR26DRAFT_871995 [Obelidium mucronatum]
MTEFEARIAAKQGNATATTTTPRDSDLSSLPGLKSLPRTARISKLAPMSPLPPLPSSHIAIAPIPGFSAPVTYADDFFDDDSVSGGGGNTTPMSPALSEGSSIYAEDVRVVSAIEGLFFVDETGDLEASIKSSRNSGSSEKQGGASNSVGLGLRRAMPPKQSTSSGFGEKKGLATRSGVHDFRQFGANLKILEEGQDEGVATSIEGGLVRLDSVGVARNVNVVDVALPGSGTAEIVDL